MTSWYALSRRVRAAALFVVCGVTPAVARGQLGTFAGAPADSLGPAPSYAQYVSPWECASDRRWNEHLFWRNRRGDTTYFPPEGYADQPTTVAAMRACLARFSLAGALPRDLLGFGKAYLAAEQPDLARQALATLAKIPMEPSAKAWTLYQIVTVFLETPRPLLVDAEQYAAQLDAMGAPVAAVRMLAHDAIAAAAVVRDSVPLQAHEATVALHASQELTGDARKEWGIHSAWAYTDMAALDVRQNNPAAAMAALTAGQSALVPLRPFVRSSFDAEQPYFIPVGQPAPEIQATRWYHTGSAGNRRPVPGKPTLIFFSAARCTSCYEGYGVLRRLAAKYAARGLDITLVTRTHGYFGRRLVPPDTEMTKLAAYFLDDLKLPVTLAIWRTDFGRRNDKRLTIESAPNDQAYRPTENMAAYLVDANGRVRLVTVLARANEAMLDDVIGELLRTP
jgi:hypothetical protein